MEYMYNIEQEEIFMMENLKTTYISIGQVVRINCKRTKLINWIKRNKLILIVSSTLLAIFIIYGILMMNFIHLLHNILSSC